MSTPTPNAKCQFETHGWAWGPGPDGDPTTRTTSRHEYLGPDPRVLGYFVDAAGDYHVKFYDTFLGDQWMDNRKWTFDVRLDEDGNWVDAAE